MTRKRRQPAPVPQPVEFKLSRRGEGRGPTARAADLHPFPSARSRTGPSRRSAPLSLPLCPCGAPLACSLVCSEPLRSARDESLQWHEFNSTLILQPLYHVDPLTSTRLHLAGRSARGGGGNEAQEVEGVEEKEEVAAAREEAGAALPARPRLWAALTPAAHPARGRKAVAGVGAAGRRSSGEPRQPRSRPAHPPGPAPLVCSIGARCQRWSFALEDASAGSLTFG